MTIIKYAEVSTSGSYCIDGKKYLRSTYKKGTYAAFNDNSIYASRTGYRKRNRGSF